MLQRSSFWKLRAIAALCFAISTVGSGRSLPSRAPIQPASAEPTGGQQLQDGDDDIDLLTQGVAAVCLNDETAGKNDETGENRSGTAASNTTETPETVVDCGICYDNFEEADIRVRMPCCGRPGTTNVYHLNCLERWAQSHSGKAGGEGPCPACRHPYHVFPEGSETATHASDASSGRSRHSSVSFAMDANDTSSDSSSTAGSSLTGAARVQSVDKSTRSVQFDEGHRMSDDRRSFLSSTRGAAENIWGGFGSPAGTPPSLAARPGLPTAGRFFVPSHHLLDLLAPPSPGATRSVDAGREDAMLAEVGEARANRIREAMLAGAGREAARLRGARSNAIRDAMLAEANDEGVRRLISGGSGSAASGMTRAARFSQTNTFHSYGSPSDDESSPDSDEDSPRLAALRHAAFSADSDDSWPESPMAPVAGGIPYYPDAESDSDWSDDSPLVYAGNAPASGAPAPAAPLVGQSDVPMVQAGDADASDSDSDGSDWSEAAAIGGGLRRWQRWQRSVENGSFSDWSDGE